MIKEKVLKWMFWLPGFIVVIALILFAGRWIVNSGPGSSGHKHSGKTDKRSHEMEKIINDKNAIKHKNRLANEKSPYLLQHAHNPVDWYPWGPEAFEKARKEDKPIFLSIGYSTCHWCHVMAHESFEDPETARLMNEVFVSIKVDREERPDIDNVYMTVCQMMTRRGGWPLTIIMTPDKKPFFAGTYIPKRGRFGQLGMIELTKRIGNLWKNRRNEILESADEITGLLRQTSKSAPGIELDGSILKVAYRELKGGFDNSYGGFERAPKFPAPHNMLFLLRRWKRTADPKALEMVEKTLKNMRRGGIYDHVGFGFHRYSTDREWLLPHFEKMLYDQAMISMAYIEAYQATGKEEYKKTAEEIFEYVMRDMTSPEGGFYSAEDADSEGEEGKFYVWDYDEIFRILGKDEARLFVKAYNIRKNGNFHDEATRGSTGKNIPHIRKSISKMAEEMKMSPEILRKRVENSRKNLFAYREKRVHPHKDDKILTDWNGLMIASLAKGARVFNEPKYQVAADKALNFILKKMRKTDGRLLHRYRDGEASIPAYVDDYAFLVWGLLEMYETTFDVKYLKLAIELNKDQIERFWDEKNGGFYFSADDSENLLVRQKKSFDGAIPSGNSVAMMNMLKLARITGNPDLEDKAAKIGSAFHRDVNRVPSAHSSLLSAVDFGVGPSFEVVIAGRKGEKDTNRLIRALRFRYLPAKVVIFRPVEKPDGIVEIADFTKYQIPIDGKATAYVCVNYACLKPVTDAAEMIKLLSK